ncbi:MAG: hypothetical protein ACR2PR_12770 [Pseudohongiellaceae bacterium]
MSEHSTSQMHGKSFENMIKAANGIFTLAVADRKRSPNNMFDIDAGDDRVHQLPTSIKSTNDDTLSLADARRFWESFDFMPYRMLVGSYKQEEQIKIFNTIHEIILSDCYKSDLLGEITAEEISDFHDGIKSFGFGKHKEARAWAQERKRELQPKCGLVTLNPKIDSKKQRRLQCSVQLPNLIEILDDCDQKLHKKGFGKLLLPIRIVSGTRKFGREP